jgi:hypothetical protein
LLSERLARELGIDVSRAKERAVDGKLEVPTPSGLRLGGLALDLKGVRTQVLLEPRWLFNTTRSDANLPSTVLRRYQVVFDYPNLELTVAQPGSLQPRGIAAPATVDPRTGIVQMDAGIAGDTLSFAFDNGASYSFTSARVLQRLAGRHPDWPTMTGAVGNANIWGWWPREEAWRVIRVPEIRWGGVVLSQVGLVGLGEVFGPGFDLGVWYSQKTAHPVDGFLGPNAFKAFRVEIDFPNSTVYFAKGPAPIADDMDIVGLTLRPEMDGGYSVLGVARKDGQAAVPGVEPGDRLLQVDDLDVAGATMGTVVGALRGDPGEIRILVLEREGRRRTVEARVERLLGRAPGAGAQENTLDRHLRTGEAQIWYLGHSGWAVRTQNHFLIFDYWEAMKTMPPGEAFVPPDDASLATGYIVPSEIADQNVIVFVSHAHSDHFDPVVLTW